MKDLETFYQRTILFQFNILECTINSNLKVQKKDIFQVLYDKLSNLKMKQLTNPGSGAIRG